MTTGTPTVFKFMTLEHPLGEPDCWQCWDLEATLCDTPRCEGYIHHEVEDWYANEFNDPVWIVATCCDKCGKFGRFEWVDEEANLEEDDDDYEYEE